MTHLKIMTAAAVLISLASTPAFAQVAPIYGPDREPGYGPAPYPYDGESWSPTYAPPPYYAQTGAPYTYGPNWSYDNSGWNGYNNGGNNNTWFDGRAYRSDPRPRGEDIAADAADGAPFRGYGNGYGGSYAMMGDGETSAAADDAACEQRFKSYDPATGTYRGYDGKRHACR